jgi:MFS family permease
MFYDAIGKNISSSSMDYATRLRSFSPNARQYLLFVFLTTLNAGIYGVIFNLYILRLGFREDFLGLILSLASVMVGLFAIPSAVICDRLGRKNTLLLSSAILLFSLIFLYTTTSESLLALFSITYGISSSLYLVVGATFLVENSSPYERMHLFSVYYVIYTLAILAGNMIGGVLPDVLAGTFRMTLYVSIGLVAFAFIPLLFIKEKKVPTNGLAGQLSLLGSVFQSKTIRNMLFVYCIYGAGWGLAMPYFNVYFSDKLGAGTSQIGMIFTLSQLVMMLGYFSVPLFTERLGKVRMVTLVQTLSIPFLLLFTVTSSVLIAAFGFIMRYLLMNMANPVLNSFKLEIARKEQHAVVNSLAWMACYTFVGIGNYAGGLMLAGGHYALPFQLTCVLYGVTAVLYLALFQGIEKRQIS